MLLRSIVFPSLDSTLDALIVEIGVILFLEAPEHALELFNLPSRNVSLIAYTMHILGQLFDPELRQTSQHCHLSTLARAPDHFAALLPLDFCQTLGQPVNLQSLSLDLCLQTRNAVLNLLCQTPCLSDQFFPSLSCSIYALLPYFVLFLPLLANFRTLIFTLDPSYMIVFVAPVAAKLVVAYAVVDVDEGDVAWLMTLVLAVEAREGLCFVY